MSTPTPAVMTRFAKRVTTTAVVAEVAETTPAAERTTVGQRVVPNIIKAVHVQGGITVRSWLKGAPRGKEHQVESVERLENGNVRIAFVDQPASEYKAAYRWYVVDSLGLDLRYDASITEPALVPYQEV